MTIQPLTKDTYLSAIRNSIGANTYRNAFALVDGAKKDIAQDGEYSCAFFASSLLTTFGFIKSLHLTVSGTVRDLEQSGWTTVTEPKPGAVLIWESKIDNQGESHKHIGFYVGEHQAISNSSELKTPQQHHWTYGEENGTITRRIEAIYWHSSLD